MDKWTWIITALSEGGHDLEEEELNELINLAESVQKKLKAIGCGNTETDEWVKAQNNEYNPYSLRDVHRVANAKEFCPLCIKHDDNCPVCEFGTLFEDFPDELSCDPDVMEFLNKLEIILNRIEVGE